MRRVKTGLVVALALVLLVFVVQNTEVVDVRFFAWSIEMSRAIMLLAVLAVGFMIGWLTSTLRRRKG